MQWGSLTSHTVTIPLAQLPNPNFPSPITKVLRSMPIRSSHDETWDAALAGVFRNRPKPRLSLGRRRAMRLSERHRTSQHADPTIP